ncbi:hypothetical protein [Neolewinella persica]|uniref:hypothetical protein n=1 Tax=Neolewinella persica TaxID=70998 RepID=UPI000377CABC|nr:hypothetical protein [Neolewinella persica]
MANSLKWSCLVLIVLGAILWLINWWAGRPLFLDEANVARNLFDRSFSGLFSPLDHRQYAPPLYLVAAKLCGELFGYGERALRLPALAGGTLAIIGLFLTGKSLKLGWWLLLPLALAFLNPDVLRYVSEVKPYSIDLGVAALITGMACTKHRFSWVIWGIAGVLMIWLSLPAVFVLAAAGAAQFMFPEANESKQQQSERLIWLGIGTCWLLSFALLYLTVLRPAIGSSYLNTYHETYFFPLPQQNYPWEQLGNLLFSIPKLAFGFTAIAIVFGTAALVAGWLRSSWFHRTLLVGPLLLVLVVSGFGYYSLIPRLLLFVLPGLWVLATMGSKYVFETTNLPGLWKYSFIVIWVLVLGGTNVVRHFWQPLSFSDARRLATSMEEGYTPVLHHGAVPGFDYYQRIHPETRKGTLLEVQEGDIRTQEFPGKYVLLYDVLTQGNIRQSVQSDSTWATARGCKVKSEAMFRAKAVYVDCGE